ncbi:hypothetical protein FNV43_RR18525 [Rhamnella rubrinervis]|uniref:Uncharacterized protein n=1 Tax=Rhamnella rubrinervis TaxID=2594499 RepID=A0A8K0EB58_9ROSA|nr:hypothetical protein FNV43_RR18525 [Rhamnella rubrinervis]
MKLIWSPETASKAYIETVKSCEKFKESGVAELLSAMAAGWNAKLIVEAWSHDGPIATSVGLAIAARATGGRHVCVVPDERSRLEYAAAMRNAASSSAIPEIAVGEAETAMAGLVGVRFSHAKCMATKRFGVQMAMGAREGTRVVRSVFLPVGKGLDIAHIGSNSGTSTMGLKKGPSRWIKHVDQRSGEEHVFRK